MKTRKTHEEGQNSETLCGLYGRNIVMAAKPSLATCRKCKSVNPKRDHPSHAARDAEVKALVTAGRFYRDWLVDNCEEPTIRPADECSKHSATLAAYDDKEADDA